MKIYQLFSEQRILGVDVTIAQQNAVGLVTELLLNSVYTMLVKIIKVLIMIFLSNLIFNSYTKMKMKNE